MKPNQFTLVQISLKLFQEKGFEKVNMVDIALQANISEPELYTYFGSKQDIILSLYQSLNVDWQLKAENILDKKISARFAEAMKIKIELVEPYADVLGNMLGLLLQSPKIGIHTPRTSHIRAIGLRTMQSIIDGSTDSRSLKNKIERLPSLFYIIHWFILFIHIQTRDKEKTLGLIQTMSKLLHQVNNLSLFVGLFPFVKDISAWADGLLNEKPNQQPAVDREILKIVFNNRKATQAEPDCLKNNCETCVSMHLPKISYFTSQKKPIHFILPAFPAKSPNPQKVLGTKPDLGEKIALNALEDICKEIKIVYGPGAKITICSDGRIFSELVGVNDENVTEYVNGIKSIIENQQLQHIDIVNLEDLLEGNSFDDLRNKVISKYAEPLECLSEKLKTNQEFNHLFNGIHRFIVEDRKGLESEKSITRIKEESKPIALKVIQHSNAWTRFLAYIYPDSVRLSIHPYPTHCDKIGIQLTKTNDNWLTPWHGVIVMERDGYVLMKKHEAENLNAKLILENDQPFCYTLIPQ